MTSRIHDTFVAFFTSDIFPSIRSWLPTVAPGYEARLIVLPLFKLTGNKHKKAPDCGIEIGRPSTDKWHEFIVEVGYSETEKELLRDAEA
jgi:hypothetical protein